MKKIAIIIRDRQSEALRMAIGLSILHKVDIFIVDSSFGINDEILMSLNMIKELKMSLYTNNQECLGQIKGISENISYMPITDIAKKILEYDNILAY